MKQFFSVDMFISKELYKMKCTLTLTKKLVTNILISKPSTKQVLTTTTFITNVSILK